MFSFEDTIFHKPHTEHNDIKKYRYDHYTGTNIKRINVLSAFYIADIHDEEENFAIASCLRYSK